MGKTSRVALTVDKKKKHAEYMREKRKAWTEEERKRNNEQSKLRMRKRREKLKQESSNLTLVGDTRQKKLSEKKELERKRAHTEYKRKYRAQLSSQKKRRIQEKDASKKREKRREIKEKKNGKKEDETEAGTGEIPETSFRFNSAPALKKMVYRAKKKFPKSPRRYATVVKGLATSVTPKRQASLKEQGMMFSPNAKKNLLDILDVVEDVNQELQGKAKKRRREFVRHFAERLNKKSQLQSVFCAVTGIKRKYLDGCCSDRPRKRQKDVVSSEVQESVQKCYQSEELDVVVPDKKAMKKDLEQTQVMQMSLSTAW